MSKKDPPHKVDILDDYQYPIKGSGEASYKLDSKKKINIAKIRMNSHELHSETGRWAVPETPWVEMIWHICENMNIEDKKHFILECPAYTHIRSQFYNICCNIDFLSLSTCQNYNELEMLLSKLFENKNTILKQTK